MMFPIFWPGPSTSISLGTGPVCFFAHEGSASIVIGLIVVGGVPLKVTVPVMEDAANATLGHAAVSIRPAARDNRVAVLRIVDSFVNWEVYFSSRLYTGFGIWATRAVTRSRMR